MDIAAGQWAVFYDGVQLAGIESAEPEVETDTVSITDISGNTINRPSGRQARVVLSVFDTGIANLKKILPDNWVAQATQIEGQPTGTVATAGVSNPGVINFGKVNCGSARLIAPLQLVPCENPLNHTVTLWDGYARITGVTLEDTVLKFEVTIESEANGVMLTKGGVTIP